MGLEKLEDIIKRDLINWCGIDMDFYYVKKKGLIRLRHQYFDSLSLVDLCPPSMPRLFQSEIMASGDWWEMHNGRIAEETPQSWFQSAEIEIEIEFSPFITVTDF